MPRDSIRRRTPLAPVARQSAEGTRRSGGITRRDALQSLSLGALALSQARLLSGCGSSGERASAHASQAGYWLDPDRPWWLQAPFGAVEENEAFELDVVGEIPRALNGVFLRNGSNPQYVDRGHWYFGDGMLHAMSLQDGKAHWYRNRYVETSGLIRSPHERGRLMEQLDICNVNVIHHAGRLLALGEHGSPYEISLEDLSTIGRYDFAGRLTTATAAHPKLDPRTGELHMIGYEVSEPYLTYHLVNAAGELVRSEPITVPQTVLMHDFQITASSVVMLDHPIRFDLALAVAGELPFRWQPEFGTRIGIMPRSGGDADVTWIEVENFAVLHGFNAYDDDAGNVVFDVVEWPRIWVNRPSMGFIDREEDAPRFCRYTIDVKAKRVKREQLDDRGIEVPQIDRRLVGAPHRYGYARWSTDFVPFLGGGLVKYDLQRASEAVYEYEPGRSASEPFFVPASANAEEDEGFLLTFAHDLSAGGSLDIFDARALSAGPLARVKVPWSIPIGFHGTWFAA